MRTYQLSFKADQICGHYLVLSDVTGHGTDRAHVKCTTCGHETRVKLFTLSHLLNEVARGAPERRCKVCQLGANRVVSQKHCTKCEDMPWRRKIGKPCRCGGVFAPEMVERPGVLDLAGGVSVYSLSTGAHQ